MRKSDKYEALGAFVEVNGHKMHVFCTGQGKETFVFMAGHGTSCPTLDFKPLWSILSTKHRIVVVERAGYGWSEATNTSRDLDIVLEETRQALILSNIEAPFVLVSHSMSGLEAIYWAQKYPSEVKAIIGLDSAIPETYDTFKIPSAPVIKTLGFLAKIGVHKPFAKAICKKSPAVKSGYLTRTDIEAYIERFRKSTFTSDMLNEGRYLMQNSNKVKNGHIPRNTPIYIFISEANKKVIPNWVNLLSNYVSTFQNGKYIILNCGHYIHNYEPIKIAKEINSFISSISRM